jgi:peptidoglycan/LPS O-acetylase OafA/YrhL
MQKKPTTQGIIPSLNGLRAISILMVVGSHLQGKPVIHDNKFLRATGHFIFNGGFGVNIFLVISGFLITKLLINELTQSGRVSLKNFYLRRMIRIFPAYYFLLFSYSLLQLTGYFHINLLTWVGVVTFTKQFFVDNTSEIDHLWSLSVEEVFYLIWPFAFINFKEKSIHISIYIIALVAIIRILTTNFPAPSLSLTIFARADALLIGSLIAIYYEKITQWVLSRQRMIYLVVPALLVSIFAYTYFFSRLSNSIGNQQVNYFLLRIAYGFLGSQGLIINLLIGFILIYSIHVRNRWFWLLNIPIMNHLGKLSYSIYLWQQLFTADREVLNKIPIAVLLGLIYLIAYCSYKFIEKPFMGLKRKYNLEATNPIFKNTKQDTLVIERSS